MQTVEVKIDLRAIQTDHFSVCVCVCVDWNGTYSTTDLVYITTKAFPNFFSSMALRFIFHCLAPVEIKSLNLLSRRSTQLECS